MVYIYKLIRFVAALFRFVALGLRTLVGTGSRRWHISQSQASFGGECFGGKQPRWNLPGGIYRSPKIRPLFLSKVSLRIPCQEACWMFNLVPLPLSGGL